MQPSKSVRWSVYALAALPACSIAFLILRYGVDVPYWDQWDLAPFFEKYARGTLTLADLFAQQNEYRQFVPNLIFVGAGWLTRWDVRVEMLISWLLACVVCLNVFRLGKLTAGGGEWQRLLPGLLASLFIFSPIQYENWMFGVQIIYFVPILCVTACAVVAYSRLGARAKLIICMCLSAASTFSSANGIVCWLVALPLLAFERTGVRLTKRRWWLALWLLGLALCAAVYLEGYRKPQAHPQLSEFAFHPFEAIVYLLGFLGAPLGIGRHPLAVAVVVGLMLAIAYAASCLYVWKFRSDSDLVWRANAWLMIGAYSLLTAAMITVGRLGFGVEQSLSSRYTTFSLYLLVALVYLVPVILRDATRRFPRLKSASFMNGASSVMRLAFAGACALALAQVVVAVLVWRHDLEDMRRRRLQGKACLLFINVVREECPQKLFSDTELLRERANALDRMGFLRPALIKSNSVRDFEGADPAADANHHGVFEQLVGAGGEYNASGWAVLTKDGEPADAVLLAYEDEGSGPFVFALAEMDAATGDAAVGPRPVARWHKTFSLDKLPSSSFKLSAWAFDATTGKAYRLAGTHAPN